MGLVSPSDSGNFTLSIGVMLASCQIPGTAPLLRLVLTTCRQVVSYYISIQFF
jgi:hypothetical protein